MFADRHALTQQDLARHAQFPEKLTVAITGASGLIGTALSRFLSLGGHTVIPLVRRGTGVRWDPDAGTIDVADLNGVDAIVHLAGQSIVAGRWSAEFRRSVSDSRIKGTELIARTAAGLVKPPRVLISASAVGFYGDGGERVCDEHDPPGAGFLADLVARWEQAADPARAAGIRVVHPRFGIVLSPAGGALPELMRPLRLGVSAQFGNGQQYQSWIGLDDTVYALHYALFTAALRGPANFTAPEPLRQKDLVKYLARAMHRPALGFVPRPAAELLFGHDKAREIFFFGQKAPPRALDEAGFRFWHRDLRALLAHILSSILLPLGVLSAVQ